MACENFNKFFNSQKGQEMILKMDEPQNKICITLHKYIVSLITRRKFKKNIKYYKQEGKILLQKCLSEKTKFDLKKESFDNCIIIFYEEDNSSSL